MDGHTAATYYTIGLYLLKGWASKHVELAVQQYPSGGDSPGVPLTHLLHPPTSREDSGKMHTKGGWILISSSIPRSGCFLRGEETQKPPLTCCPHK